MNSKNTMKPLVIKTNKGDTFFNYQDIIRFEADGCHTLIYHTNGETLTSQLNITNLEKELPENIFFRSHRSHIINMAFVSNFNNKTAKLTVAGEEVPISETYQQKFVGIIKGGKEVKYIG